MSQHPRFNVFGRIVEVQRHGAQWQSFLIGADGKRAPAGWVVPDFIEADELAQYLADLFHENAMPDNGEVHRIS